MGYIGAGVTRFNTADELTVTGDAEFNGNAIFGDNDKAVFGAGSDLQIYHDGSNSFISDASGTGNLKILTNTLQIKNSADTEIGAKFIEDGAVTLYHNNAEKLATTSGGIDVTGTVTADGLTVDGSGLFQASGTGNIELTLKNNNVSPGSGRILFADTVASDAGVIQYEHGGGADAMVFKTATNEAMRIDSSGNVGIGTSSPSAELEIASTQPKIKLTDTDGGVCDFVDVGGNLIVRSDVNNTEASSHIRFDVDGSEAMRIDSSGNLLVGKTANSIGGSGVVIRGGGELFSTRAGDVAGFNRLTTDGPIVQFYKDSSTVGSIEADGGKLVVNSSGSNLVFGVGGVTYINMDSSSLYPESDNSYDLGISSRRFDDIYATNGTIQTSDANEKQQIASLTDAEITAAKSISALFKTYKWNSAVEEKGDAARTHAGVIAQEVQAAMADAGLDAGDYAFFISSTWWETQTEVPAVEAVAEVLDADGNVVTEAVEAADAYTRTDTYETAEEAPDGAVERTRLGIRYPELLAFIGAATERRLANIETRLAALETN